MGISLKTNLTALTATRHMNRNSRLYDKSLERVASGKRINQPGDDPAGLAIATGLKAQIQSVGQAERNTEDARSLIQVAGGGLNDISNLMIRVRELAMQAASDTVGEREREMINLEATESIEEIERIAQSTTYLGTQLLNGEGDEFIFQVGPNNTEYDRIDYDGSQLDVTSGTLGVDGIDLTDRDSAADALETLDEGLSLLHLPIAQLGAVQNRMQSTIDNLQNYGENITSAHSRIIDADFAKETAEMTKGMIQREAGAAVLSQASASPSIILKLLS